jgi:hypothetical protein
METPEGFSGPQSLENKNKVLFPTSKKLFSPNSSPLGLLFSLHDYTISIHTHRYQKIHER